MRFTNLAARLDAYDRQVEVKLQPEPTLRALAPPAPPRARPRQSPRRIEIRDSGLRSFRVY